MTIETLFDQTQVPNTEAIESYMDHLVGDGKKFKSPEELAKGKYEADTFIQKLLDEKKQLETELATRARLEDLLDQLEPPAPNTPSTTNQTAPEGTPAAIDETLIENILNRREQERKALDNINEAKTQLQKFFGDDYVQKLDARASQLGISRQELDALAKKSPKAFMALVAPQSKSDPLFTPPTSKVNTPIPHGTPQVRSWEWYQNLKKTNPTVYWSAKVQSQLHKDAIDAANKGLDF